MKAIAALGFVPKDKVFDVNHDIATQLFTDDDDENEDKIDKFLEYFEKEYIGTKDR